MTLTNKDREKLVSKVIKGLKRIEQVRADLPSEISKLIVRGSRCLTAEISPYGEVAFTLCVMDREVKNASQHVLLSLHKAKGDMAAEFEPVAALLGELLPGQPLFWSMDDADLLRHELFFGTDVRHAHAIISSVASRWKTPLTKLSTYLAAVPKGKTLSRWHSSNAWTNTSLITDAWSLEGARLLEGFSDFSQSAFQVPSASHNLFVLREAETLDVEQVYADFLQGCEDRTAELNERQSHIERDLAEANEALAAAIAPLCTEETFSIKTDLLSCETAMAIEQIECAHRLDHAANDRYRHMAKEAFSRIAARVSVDLRALYPGIRHAELEFIRTKNDLLSNNPGVIYLTLDDVRVSLHMQGFGQALKLACMFGAADREGEDMTFAICESDGTDYWHANRSLTNSYHNVRSPGVALLTRYCKNQNAHITLPEAHKIRILRMEAVTRAEAAKASEGAKEACEIYH